MLARGGGQPDHAAGDPHQGAAQGRHRGAEAAVAAADRRRRDHGRHLGHRARHRLRRRVGHVPRRAGRARRQEGLRHQRRQGVVHVRRPRQRAGAARAHRSRSEEGRARASRSSSSPKDAFPGHEFEMKQPSGGVLHGKADATPGYRGMHSFTLDVRQLLRAGREPGRRGGRARTRASICRWRASPPAACRPAGARPASRRRRSSAPAEYANDRKQFGQPIGEFQLTQYKLGRMATHIAAGAPAHLRGGARDGRGRVDRARAGDGEALRLRRRRVGDAGGPAPARRLGLRRGVRDLALRRRRARCCRSSRA